TNQAGRPREPANVIVPADHLAVLQYAPDRVFVQHECPALLRVYRGRSRTALRDIERVDDQNTPRASVGGDIRRMKGTSRDHLAGCKRQHKNERPYHDAVAASVG